MPQGATARLLVSCPDQPGIIAAATAFVAGHGGNVIDLQQHTDHTDEAFGLARSPLKLSVNLQPPARPVFAFDATNNVQIACPHRVV